MKDLAVNDNQTMLPHYMTTFKSDLMDCNIAWCRFASSQNENLARKKHRHVVHEMHFVLSGKIRYDFGEHGERSVASDNFAVIPQGLSHTVYVEAGDELKYLVIAFAVSSSNEAINSIFSRDGSPLTSQFTEAMRNMISALDIKKQEKNFNYSLSTKLLIQSILLEAVDSLTENRSLSFLPARTSMQKDVRIDSVVKMITGNIYSEKLRGEDVAAMLGITVRQLNRISNQHFGCSINNYIVQRRIQEMKNLLKYSAYSLSDIGELFGFSDVYAFIRHFKRFTGEAPGRYRKVAHGGKNVDEV